MFDDDARNRFMSKVVVSDDGCWVWTGPRERKGHGKFNYRRSSMPSHKWMYYVHYGRLDSNVEILQTCGNPQCVNPDHLVAATPEYRLKQLIVVDPVTGCWLWQGNVMKDGYGRFSLNGKLVRAHRASYEIFKRRIPKGHVVRHRCDNPSCVNPDHLCSGTQKQNVHDMIKAGRRVQPAVSDAQIFQFAKLTPEIAEEVRLLHDAGLSEFELAARFGVKPRAIRDIVKFKTWKDKRSA